MIQGVNLSILAGPVIPVPVPAVVADALISARVVHATTEDSADHEDPIPARSGFELQFVLEKGSLLETIFLLAGGSSPPLIRIVLVTNINGSDEVIMDGFVQQQQLTPATAGNPPILKLLGKDVTAAMDMVDLSGIPYPAMPTFARVAMILAKYAAIGVVPMVIPPVLDDVSDPTEKIASQKGTDFAYVTRLARENGYVFYSEPGPAPGVSRAYWGPEIKVGTPQPALNLDMDALTNVDSLSFKFDNEKSTTPIAWVRNDEIPFPIPVPIPDISLTNPPLGLLPPASFRVEPLPDTAKLSVVQAMLRGLARKASTSECVTAEGTLDVQRYGRLLQARKLVGVRGAGTAFDGLYYVKRVTHEIQRDKYTQSFQLSRNGLVSTVPTVPT